MKNWFHTRRWGYYKAACLEDANNGRSRLLFHPLVGVKLRDARNDGGGPFRVSRSFAVKRFEPLHEVRDVIFRAELTHLVNVSCSATLEPSAVLIAPEPCLGAFTLTSTHIFNTVFKCRSSVKLKQQQEDKLWFTLGDVVDLANSGTRGTRCCKVPEVQYVFLCQQCRGQPKRARTTVFGHLFQCRASFSRRCAILCDSHIADLNSNSNRWCNLVMLDPKHNSSSNFGNIFLSRIILTPGCTCNLVVSILQ